MEKKTWFPVDFPNAIHWIQAAGEVREKESAVRRPNKIVKCRVEIVGVQFLMCNISPMKYT